MHIDAIPGPLLNFLIVALFLAVVLVVVRLLDRAGETKGL
jgi:hypothetical protein